MVEVVAEVARNKARVELSRCSWIYPACGASLLSKDNNNYSNRNVRPRKRTWLMVFVRERKMPKFEQRNISGSLSREGKGFGASSASLNSSGRRFCSLRERNVRNKKCFQRD